MDMKKAAQQEIKNILDIHFNVLSNPKLENITMYYSLIRNIPIIPIGFTIFAKSFAFIALALFFTSIIFKYYLIT